MIDKIMKPEKGAKTMWHKCKCEDCGYEGWSGYNELYGEYRCMRCNRWV